MGSRPRIIGIGSIKTFLAIMVLKTEIIRGEFDPRKYKKDDPHWAKKRKSEYLAFPGTINFTRERTFEVDSEGEEDHDGVDEEKESCKEVKIKVEKNKKNSEEKKILAPFNKDDIWPRRMATDITRFYVIR